SGDGEHSGEDGARHRRRCVDVHCSGSESEGAAPHRAGNERQDVAAPGHPAEHRNVEGARSGIRWSGGGYAFLRLRGIGAALGRGKNRRESTGTGSLRTLEFVTSGYAHESFQAAKSEGDLLFPVARLAQTAQMVEQS